MFGRTLTGARRGYKVPGRQHMSAPTALRRRLSELEAETASVFAALRGAQSEIALSGHFLIVETGGVAALLPAPAVREIVRVVELQPLEGAGPMVAGTFVYRGAPAVAIRLGAARDFSIDAQSCCSTGRCWSA